MPMTAYIERMLDEVSRRASKGGAAADPLFAEFVRHAGRQIRAPHHARHSARSVVDQLLAVWNLANQQHTSLPLVEVHAKHGPVIAITVMPDQPFIVDTVRLELRRRNATFVGGFNLVFALGRDESGKIVRIGDTADGLESLIWSEAEGLGAEAAVDLADTIRDHLHLSQVVAADFHKIAEKVSAARYRFARLAEHQPEAAAELQEAAEFLRWLLADHFVFMGATAQGEGHGICRGELQDKWDTEGLREWSDTAGFIEVRKGRVESPVHRAGRVDEIRVAVPGEGAQPPEILCIQGLFTYRAVTQPSRHVPLLRRVLANILEHQDSKVGSYRYKGISNVFDSLPTEFLFTASQVEIAKMIDRVLEAEQSGQVRAHVVQDRNAGTTFALAAMPRGRWTDQLREDIQEELLTSTGASYSDHGVFFGRFDTMLVHFFLTGARDLDAAEVERIRARVVTLATPWQTLLHEALVERFGPDEGDRLIIKYSTAFDEKYRRHSSPDRAARDIAILQRLGDEGVAVDRFVDAEGQLHLRLYQSHDILLTDILPILDNFGLIVIDQYADTIRFRKREPTTLDTFRIKGVWGLSHEELLERQDKLVEGLEAVFAKRMTDDLLNRLLLKANIPWQAVDLIRAYNGYARQLGLRYTLIRIRELLTAQPALVRALWELFQVRFDPDLNGSRAAKEEAISETCQDLIRGINDHDQDVLFRTLLNLIESTLRTNFYRNDRPLCYLSFKVDHSKIKTMPLPKMMYEIYVHHREVEGLHLRGGKIARGGIRWSDREDYRREILDLVSTQMVKNVLIVPEGAKGGFFMKQNYSDPKERRRKADELYQILIRGLLDLTDNIVGGEVVHPPRVVIHDGLDPYLVVAADKGTAHLSDTANSLSQAYGFWLDDAFASGGSFGYDHKKVGITARGGWELVNRHFLEMGLDPKTQEFTCVGVGDPAGDVFGNGVIEHRNMKLLGAFNHLHVFIDPDPDVPASFEERLRLFNEVKGWDAYDTSKISEGGGIFSRRAKSIQLSPQIQKMLGVLQDELPVDTVIRLLLRLDVDLLWNGGIGTYFKAREESHADAGDPTNDDLRVNADELRCKVVGEGGNLGFTQKARIEYALRGGRLNNDAIDNSGGVDMSDHEVNLKILLNVRVAEGEITLDQRNILLEKLTDEVARFVLQNNDMHGLQLSLDQRRSAADPMRMSRVIEWACRQSEVSRATLRLPSEDDLVRRRALRVGLTRPELAVLQAHVKMHVFKQLKALDKNQIPDFDQRVLSYFPAEVRERWPGPIGQHMLHQSIGMTVVTTEIVGASGAEFFPLAMELTGADAVTVAGAWYRAVDTLDVVALEAEIKACGASLDGQYRAWVAVLDAVRTLVHLWLAPGEAASETTDQLRAALDKIASVRGSIHEQRIKGRAAELVRDGIPERLADRIGLLGEVAIAREIARNRDEGERLAHATIRYLALGEASRILPAILALQDREAQGGWDPVAIGILRGRYLVLMRQLCAAFDLSTELQLGVDRVATRLARGPLAELRDEVEHILGSQPDLAALLVAEERVRARMARMS